MLLFGQKHNFVFENILTYLSILAKQYIKLRIQNVLTSTLLISLISLGACVESEKGCTDPKALNYNPKATESDGACTYEIELNQHFFDEMAFSILRADVTGDAFPSSDAHGAGTPTTSDSTIRDVYQANIRSDGSLYPGSIFMKKIYAKHTDGSKGELKTVVVIFKQSEGYDSEHEDYQYFVVDGSTVSEENPNGVLPEEGSSNMGKISSCINCHLSAGGGDYIFTN